MIGFVRRQVQNCLLKMQNRHSNRFAHGSFLKGKCVFEGANFLDVKAEMDNSTIGYASYIGRNSTITKCCIGRYSCIGPNVRIVAGEHPSKTFVSLHPAFFSLKKQSGFTYVDKQLFEEEKYADEIKQYYVHIGHDVWIGDGARIMSGVRIGNGAIVAAGALVTKDVKDYEIVGGVPARQIRMRFTTEQVEKLQQIRWWDRNEGWLKQHADTFNDIDAFITRVCGN